VLRHPIETKAGAGHVQRPSICRRIAGIGFRDPAMPLALAPAVRCSVVESGRSQLSDRRQTLVELRPPYGVLPSIFQPVRRSGWAPLLDFRSLQHMQASAIVLVAASFPKLAALPPSGFGYPHDGFIPPKPGRFCFVPAALLGFALRSFPLSHGARSVSTRADPHADCSSGSQRRTKRRGRPGRPRLLGFAPCGSPLRPPRY
jgi:hypothetical protein